MTVSAETLLERVSEATARDQLLIAAWQRRERKMAQPPDRIAALRDATKALESVGAAHALIGGVAVGIHSGVPRATLDIDLAVLSSVDRRRVLDVMAKAGFRVVGQFPHSANFRHASDEPVQLAFDPEFDRMIERADHFDAGGVSIPIVRKDDLIAMKERSAADPRRRRSKALRDRADLELLRGDVPDPDEGW
jgi:hypothetical protein